MLDALRKLISDFTDEGHHPSRFASDDYRVAACALLVHTATIDGGFSEPERRRLHGLVMQRFRLDDEAADELIAEAIEVERRSIDLYQFTSRLGRLLVVVGCARLVVLLWQIVNDDGNVTEIEDNLIWRAADLLGVSRDAFAQGNVAGNVQA